LVIGVLPEVERLQDMAYLLCNGINNARASCLGRAGIEAILAIISDVIIVIDIARV
jgi:hypothetical protein